MFELPSVLRSLRQGSNGAPLLDNVLGYRCDGDWQVLQCYADHPRVADLVVDTQAPALAIFTLESAVADVRAASPLAAPWFAILNPVGGRNYDVPDAGPIEEVTARAVAWATEGGLVADPARVTTAISMRPGPFSEGITEFLKSLGLRFGDRQPVTVPQLAPPLPGRENAAQSRQTKLIAE